MKKGLFFAFWMALIAAPLAAQTIEVSGEYHGHVLWDADTVRVMGDVVIEPDEGGRACLTIERGTWVIAEGYYRITVHNGSLYALGVEKVPVTFTARDTTDFENPDVVSGWRGLHVLSDQSNAPDSVIMEYCVLRYGKVLNSAPEEEWNGAGLKVVNKKYCQISDCHFTDNYAYKANPYLSPGMGGGAVYVDNPTRCFVERCLFERNYACWGASLLLRGLRYFTVNDCEFRENSGTYGTAMYMWLGEVGFNSIGPRVYNNYIHANHGNALYLSWDWSVGRLHDNIIVNNEGYAPVIGGTAPNYSLYYNNTIANNQSDGFIGGSGKGIWTCGQQKIFNNIFYGNMGVCFERMDPTHEDPTLFNNNLAFNDGYSGTDPVFGDPEFVRPTLGLGPEYDFNPQQEHADWSLQETSLCRGAGAANMSQYYPDTDFLGNPRVVYGRIDLGAIEFQDLDAVEEQATQSCVYPNPGGNTLNIRTALPNAHVEVYDLNGKLIHYQVITDETTSINAEDWASGVYVWKVYTGVSTGSTTLAETGKWIKE